MGNTRAPSKEHDDLWLVDATNDSSGWIVLFARVACSRRLLLQLVVTGPADDRIRCCKIFISDWPSWTFPLHLQSDGEAATVGCQASAAPELGEERV